MQSLPQKPLSQQKRALHTVLVNVLLSLDAAEKAAERYSPLVQQAARVSTTDIHHPSKIGDKIYNINN